MPSTSFSNMAEEEEHNIEIGCPPKLKNTMAIASECFQQVGNYFSLKPLIFPNADFADPSNRGRINLTIPGAVICPAMGIMRGHGTFVEGVEGANLHSSLAGVVIQTNKLVRVKPVKTRYQGEVGDVVVGRVVEVQQKRWKVDTNSRLHSVLLLASVNLPGGELRRKSIEDELAMREYLREGDLVSAEVQQCFHDGALSLQTRSLKYGKLGQGQLIKVLPHLVRRRKVHFHNLPFGASVILGCNGYIWVSRHKTEEEQRTGGYIEDTERVPLEVRDAIARTANCIKLLARNSIPLDDTTIIFAYNASMPYTVRRLVETEVADEIAELVIQQFTASLDDDQPIPMHF